MIYIEKGLWKSLVFSNFVWLLKDNLEFEWFLPIFGHDQNNCLHVTSIYSRTATVKMLRTLVLDLAKIQDCRYDIVLSAKIKFLAPQKLAIDWLKDNVKV